MDENYRNRILGETMIVCKFTCFNHLSEMITSDKEIIRLLKGQNSYMARREYGYTFGSTHYLYIYFRDAGSFKKLSDMLAEYTEFTRFSDGYGTGSDSLAAAEYALETGDFDKVKRNSLLAIEKAETMSQTSIIICAKFSPIRLRIVQGRLSEALELLERMQQDVEKMNKFLFNVALDLCRGYISASICQPERIPSWLQVGDMTAAGLFGDGRYLGSLFSLKSGKNKTDLGVENMSEHKYNNKLSQEKSPYLLQHAHNPVDWYPWSQEAFEKAKKEDKPVFLSIGYSTCHW